MTALPMPLRKQWCLILLSAAFGAAVPGRAVIVSGATGNTTAPADDPGFANIGICGGASAIYLGSQWVLTAWHVGANPVTLNGTTYAVSGPATRLTNNGVGSMTANTDLVVFQIAGDPGLPSLQISPTSPLPGDDVIMIGNGVNREAARTFWQVTQIPGGANDTWVETAGAHNVEGFKTAAGSAIRWGTNDVEAAGLVLTAGFGDVQSFVTLFDDDLAGRPNEAQAISGDSGGGVFQKIGAQWHLTGLLHAIGTLSNPAGFDNAPGGTVSFNNSITAVADLSFYRDQINAIMIPEPSVVLFLTMAAGVLLGRRGKR